MSSGSKASWTLQLSLGYAQLLGPEARSAVLRARRVTRHLDLITAGEFSKSYAPIRKRTAAFRWAFAIPWIGGYIVAFYPLSLGTGHFSITPSVIIGLALMIVAIGFQAAGLRYRNSRLLPILFDVEVQCQPHVAKWLEVARRRSINRSLYRAAAALMRVPRSLGTVHPEVVAAARSKASSMIDLQRFVAIPSQDSQSVILARIDEAVTCVVAGRWPDLRDGPGETILPIADLRRARLAFGFLAIVAVGAGIALTTFGDGAQWAALLAPAVISFGLYTAGKAGLDLESVAKSSEATSKLIAVDTSAAPAVPPKG